MLDLSGVGAIRGARLIDAGINSVAELAKLRPADLVELQRIIEQIATIIVEGAREAIRMERPTAARLEEQT